MTNIGALMINFGLIVFLASYPLLSGRDHIVQTLII